MRRISVLLVILLITAATALAQMTSGGTAGGTATGTPRGTVAGGTGGTGGQAVPSSVAPVAAPSGIGGDPTRQPIGGTTQTTAPISTTPTGNQTNPNTGLGVITPNAGAGPTTPIITLGTTSPNPSGATNATSGNQAGATNSTLQPTVTGGTGSQSVFTTPQISNLPNSATASMTSVNVNNLLPGGRDLVIGGSDSAWSISPSTLSVAEAARQTRATRIAHRSRVYTNADIARLRGEAPVSTVGNVSAQNTNTRVTNEQTMPASDVEAQGAPTTPATPQGVQAPATQAPGAQQPKSPFRQKPSPQVPPR